MNGGRKFRWMAVESSDERHPKVSMNGGWKFQWMAVESSNKWRPKVPMNGAQKFRWTAAESSVEWRPKVPMNGGRKFLHVDSTPMMEMIGNRLLFDSTTWIPAWCGDLTLMTEMIIDQRWNIQHDDLFISINHQSDAKIQRHSTLNSIVSQMN